MLVAAGIQSIWIQATICLEDVSALLEEQEQPKIQVIQANPMPILTKGLQILAILPSDLTTS